MDEPAPGQLWRREGVPRVQISCDLSDPSSLTHRPHARLPSTPPPPGARPSVRRQPPLPVLRGTLINRELCASTPSPPTPSLRHSGLTHGGLTEGKKVAL